MGIDRSDVRFVVHAGAPQSLEHYQQESGRAGHDGLEAECALIYSSADFMKWRLMLEKNGELTDSARRCCAISSDMPPASGAGTSIWSAISASATNARTVGPVISVSASSSRGRTGRRGPQDSLVRGAGRPAIRRRACRQRPLREPERTGASRRHNDLTTFGLLREASTNEVRAYIEQLVAQGLLRQTDDAFPVVMLTPEGWHC